MRPVSNRGIAIFFAMLITALVLGYLFLNKLSTCPGKRTARSATATIAARSSRPADEACT